MNSFRLPLPVAAIQVSLGLLLVAMRVEATTLNGFVIEDALVPVQEIRRGGPPRDGIPALTDPVFVAADTEGWMLPADRVLGLTIKGDARAYPIAIMNYHEIVNDRVGGKAVTVTYCPLCGTGIAFDATVGDGQLEFGVSGLLYNSDVLLYDRATDSLWSQIMGRAVTGPMKGERLRMLPLRHTSWEDWQRAHPDTRVLSTLTGYARDYTQDPYAGYQQSRELYQPVSHTAPDTWHPKERVLGIELDGIYKAYPFVELNKQAETRFIDRVGKRQVKVHWDVTNQSGRIFLEDDTELVVVTGFWFAWYTFHPLTEVFQAP